MLSDTHVQMAENENHQAIQSIPRVPSSVIIPVNSPDANELPDSHNEDANTGTRRTFSSLIQYVPGKVIHPYPKSVQKWNKFLIFLFFFTSLFDLQTFFLLYVNQDSKCIEVNLNMTKILIILRSLTSFIYLLYMLHNFRLAYFAYKSDVLVDNPKRIAHKYLSKLSGRLLLDFFVVLPIFQVYMWLIHKNPHLAFKSHGAATFYSVVISLQYGAMLYRLLHALWFTSIIFRSWLTLCGGTLLLFVLFSHYIGALWYSLALHRVKQCLRNACFEFSCYKYIYCGQGNQSGRFKDDPVSWKKWETNKNVTACFGPGGFKHGIYSQAVTLTTESNGAIRYIYSIFWGFQQISTLAGNQIPSLDVLEILFTMFITAVGLLLFSILIGGTQNFIQALGRRTLDMYVRHSDIEVWMRRQRLPANLRKQVRESERYHYAATRGINELMLLENLPEDLQRDIRRHLFKFIKKIPIVALINESVLDAIKEKMRLQTYVKGSRIFVHRGLIDKMVFVVRGKLESIGEDNNVVSLSEGDVCGEELVNLCSEHSADSIDGERFRIPAHKLVSKRTVTCLTNVKAYIVRVADLEEVITVYSKILFRDPVQGATRKKSRKGFAVSRIKVAWR